MSRSNDPGHYFQTSDSLATTERKAAKSKNKHGNPIKLPSKILSVCTDPTDDNAVYITESAGEAKRIALETGKITTLRPAAGAPLTSLAIAPHSDLIYAGCWDKCIHPVSLKPSQPPATLLKGHSDFVKCLLTTTLDSKPLLISGSADGSIIIWDLTTSQSLHKLKTTEAQQSLAIDPLSLSPEDSPKDSFILFSSTSGPEIHRWRISLTSATELPESLDSPITAHATSVYALHFDGSGDLWTCSADKTAQHLVRDRDWASDTVLPHGDFVRDVLVAERAGVVVTACRDEDVKVWDAAEGRLLCVYQGHFEEVTGLALVRGGKAVVSVGIDATVRVWSLERGEMGRFMEEREREARGEGKEEDEVVVGKGKEGLLTAEEEAELAELMDDDD